MKDLTFLIDKNAPYTEILFNNVLLFLTNKYNLYKLLNSM